MLICKEEDKLFEDLFQKFDQEQSTFMDDQQYLVNAVPKVKFIKLSPARRMILENQCMPAFEAIKAKYG